MSNQTVNPPGFDMRNAMSHDDIVWPLKGAEYDFTSDTWGHMIVDDRRAQMWRDGIQPAKLSYWKGFAAEAADRIEGALLDGWDQEPLAIY